LGQRKQNRDIDEIALSRGQVFAFILITAHQIVAADAPLQLLFLGQSALLLRAGYDVGKASVVSFALLSIGAFILLARLSYEASRVKA